MTTLELISNLSSKDIEIWAEGDRLRYNAPKGALTPDLRKELAAHKSEILALLRQADTVTSSASFPLKPVSRAGDLPLQAVSRDQDLPLSFAQERLWFLHHLEPDSVAYSMPRSIRLKGVLRKDALEKTYVELARRHETLRSTFHSTGGNPVLRIAAEPNILLDTLDLRHLPGVEREAEVKRLSAENARKPFDLTRGPLFRIRLFQLEDEEHVLHSNMHHIISDFWSFGVMAREFTALYTAFIEDKPADLPELPVQYADYAVWQRQWLQGEALEAQLNYWKDKLGGELPILELPTDRPRPAVQTHRGAIEALALSKELTVALQAMSRREGVTLFMTLLAAFKTLLYRLTGQEDTIVGTPIAGRNRTELEGLIGFFMNTIVMRTDLSGQPSFRELLGRVRETALGAYAHQDMPFERLVEELAPERDLSRTPLFQVFFNHVVTMGDKAADLPGLEAEAIGGLDRESKFDMSFIALESEEGLAGRFEYNTDMFDAGTIARMQRHFQTLLEGIVADPGKCICDLPILDEAERRQLLVTWNDTAVEYPRDKCLHQLFEAQVERTPDAVALVTETEKLTYRQLNNRANRVAQPIISMGVGPENIVGVLLDRSAEMIAAILGILKAGGAYLPLDPAYPRDRLAFMLSDSQAQVLVTQSQLESQLPEKCPEILYLDTDWKDAVPNRTENPQSTVQPNNLAYLLYTSGSTGLPKGVAIEHHSPMALICWAHTVFSEKEMGGVLFSTSICFDLSVFEIFSPLTMGGKAILANNLLELPSLKAASEVTLINTVPSAIAELLRIEGIPPSVCTVNLAGELLKSSLVQEIYDVKSIKRVYDLYGPSEDTTYSTWVLRTSDGPQTVGRPISNTQIYILYQQRQLAPIGVAGELYLGGDGLARGYLHRPDLTSEKFIPNPFSEDPASRLYMTGDLARYFPDGTIEYLGRIDYQVKIRGFRIELGEIESVSGRHPAVEEAVIIAREDVPGDKRLVAYVVPSHEPTPTFSELRSFLKEKLPDYMIPSAFVYLDSLPLTPNGKVDRRALPEPDRMRPDLEEVIIAPRTQTEELVAGIWSNVLGVERIGVYDSFFELGGHSLLVVQIISRIREVFEVELPLRALFEAPTVAGLTERIETARRSDKGLQTSPLQAVSRDQDLSLSFAQERLWFLHHLEPDSVAYSMPRSIRLKGMMRKDALEKTYVELARRHEILRTSFHSTDGNPVLHIAAEPNIVFDTLDLRHLPGMEREAEAKRLSEEDARKPFDITRGPLFRIRLFQLEDQEHVLHFNMHHIISDFWSFGVMAREIAALYTAFIKGKPADLPELPVQYADYAVWQRQWLQGEALEAQLNYWKDKLGGELPVLELPTDRPRPAIQTHSGAIESLALSKELTDALQAISRREGVTLFMTLLAAFKTLLYRLTGQEDTIVGTPIAGRNRTELEGLIGFFMNTIVMRTDLSGQPSFREFLGRVRETALGAYAHQDMPFERLVEELSPERDLSRTPLFQVFFNHIVARGGKVMEFPGLETEAVGGLEDRESKFDMTLYVSEGEGGIGLHLVYNTDLFDSWRMAEMLKQYEELLKQIVENPVEKILHYSLVTTETRLILPDPAAPLTEPLQTSIIEVFANWVKQTPEQPALSKGDQTLTYEKLFKRTQTLAIILRLNGLDRGDVVAVYGPRSFGLIVNMMAVFLSGGVLLPIDNSLPRQRQQLILQESGAKFLLNIRDRGFEDAWWEQDPALGVQTLEVDTKGLVRADTDFDLDAVSLPEPGLDDAAYIFFTSGTTGVPKGILGSHKGLNHFLNWQRETFDITPEDRVAHLTSLSFDPVLREIFLPLTSGATLCLPEDIDILAANDVLSWLDRERISVLHTVPSLAQSWLTNSTVEVSLNALRWVFFAGESLTENLVDRWQSSFPSGEIVNLYGPAETTLAKCFYQLSSGVQPGVQPLGRPLPQTQALVLSGDNQLCSIGEPGEIVLRAPFRSLGYINNREENRKRFVKNPFRDDEKDQLYYTGDRGRYRPDGMLEFLGRLDDQVKIRGVRVEPNEVTVTLARHPEVDSCFVTNRRDEQGQPSLVAYVVLTEQSKTTISELRNYLSKELPNYSIPSAFVFLGALPLTTRGKVDRRALPAPDVVRPDLQEAFVAPRSQSEELVAGIWNNVLGLERIGVYDSFFELGGHSLLVVQIVSRIRGVFEVELPLRALFEAPTVAGLTERIEAACRSDEGLQTSPLQAVSRDQDLPLSFAQERLWFLHHLEPDSVAYSLPRSIRLKGMLRKSALEKTYVELARRHETLRTTFESTDGNPVLRIAAEPNILFDTVDLRHLPGVERETEAQRLSAEDARKPFDLARGPLFRIKLFRLKDEEHVLHSNMHHIISDFWSFGVMAREIATLYTAFVKGKPADLPGLPVQYADYAVWQRQWLQGEALETQLNYWKDKLGGELPVLELPTDRPRPAVQTHRGAIESLVLPKELTEALQAMSRREGVTLFMTLLAAFKTLLFRHTGQEEIIVGTPIAGRNRTELEGLIGFFMNTIVMRTDLAGQPSFRELLGRVRETALGAYAHQDMPFERLVEELSPERDLSRTPLFQVFFNHMVTRGDKAVGLPGLEAEAAGGLDRESKFDMTLHVLEGKGGLAARFEYNTDLFDAVRIERMVGHFQALLEGIVADPGKCICDLPILDESERRQLLLEWNDTAVEYPRDKCIHELFEKQVERTPDAAAVIFGKQRLTYRELNTRANQLAHHLKALGVGPEVMVGLFMERSLEMVIGIYGIIKAGGAYVPLDPEYPSDRIAFMTEETEVPVLLTQEKLVDSIPEQRAKVICLDSEWDLIDGQSAENPHRGAAPENLAYVIYTSGSTGRPKGVMNEHRGIVNRLLWMQEEYHLTPADRVLQKTPFSFDVSVWEFFWPLQTGASLIIAKPGGHRESSYLTRLIIDQKITTLHFVPSMLRVFLEESDVERCTGIKRVICSGEALPFDLQQHFFERLDTELHNLYGPTEAAVDVTYWPCRPDSDRSMVPIGYPVANTQIYILDPRLSPVPIGCIGELHIGGAQVARGYLNRSEVSAEKFIPDPFSDDTTARLYKTGDLARYLADGSIEYLGRIDFQVKIRGLRVELGEIEARLTELDAVKKCIVVVRDDHPGDQRLVAYYVLKPGFEASLSAWRNYLRSKLPDYMVPQHFVALEAIPLTPNGKVDRKVLPAPDRNRSQPAETLVVPRDDLELQLTNIWEQVLGIKNIGIKDNFFDLGGHSLLVMQLFARIQKIFGMDLPLATLFQAPSIEQLAGILRQEDWSSPWSSLVPIQHGGSKPPFFCVHGCTGRVLHFYDLARLLGPEQPFSGLSALGLERGQVPHTQFEDMAAHYIKEIRTIQLDGPYFIGGSGDGCGIAIEIAHQLESQGQNIGLIVLFSPMPLKPKISSTKLYTYRRSLRKFFFLLNNLLKKRPLIPAIINAFLTRVLWHWRIFHKYLPIHIFRWRRYIAAFRRARFSYTPRAYQGRITCFLSDEFSLNHKKLIADWYKLDAGGIDIRFVPGTINTMWQEPHVRILAEQLKACLEEAQKDNEEFIDTKN